MPDTFESTPMQAAARPPMPLAAARPPEFTCASADAEGVIAVAVAGELDITTVPQLDQALRRAEAGAVLIVLDLRDLEFMDSSGARLILAADRRIRRAGGRLVTVRGPAELDWFFALLGLDRELELVDPAPGERGHAPGAGADAPLPVFTW